MMKAQAAKGIVISVLIAAAFPILLLAQDQTIPVMPRTRYVVRALSTVGGTQGGANGVPNDGSVTGWSNLSGDQAEHAVVWRGQTMIDLGTLGGPNSASSFPIKNDKGVVAGNSQTSETDPLNENFCTFSSYTTYLCRGFRWQNGTMTALPTLGGDNSWATVVNRRGQIAGFAETGTHDPSCIAPQVLDFEAVIWGPHEDDMQALAPLPGDAIGSAFGLNDKGQAVGASGICASWTPFIYTHALLWQKGSVIDLGSLGGQVSLALFINNQGEVVGASDLAGDTAYHAFLWTNDHGMRDLGTVSGDLLSTAESINERNQIVGGSCEQNGNCRAALWQDGIVADLNSLTVSGTTLYLLNASDINDHGEIAGYAYDPSTGDSPGFLAIPCDAQHAEIEDCMRQAEGTSAASSEADARRKMTLPENVREMLLRKMRFGRR